MKIESKLKFNNSSHAKYEAMPKTLEAITYLESIKPLKNKEPSIGYNRALP